MLSLCPILIALTGVAASTVVTAVNSHLIAKFLRNATLRKELKLFYYRFVLDLILGILTISYFLCIALFSLQPELMSSLQFFIFATALPSSNIGAMRSIVTVTIALERVVAANAPMLFRNHRANFSELYLLLFAIAFGLLEDVVLFSYCEFKFVRVLDCAAFGCLLNACFLHYWTSHKSTIFAITAILSVLLFVRLVFLRNQRESSSNRRLARVNGLTLLDLLIVLAFDFLPSFIASTSVGRKTIFSFHNIGPYGATAKMLGCSVECIVSAAISNQFVVQKANDNSALRNKPSSK